jgi:transposase InsO family protein
MPWGAICAVDSKLQFIAEYLKHEESVAELCRWFGISRKTGYKLINRYEQAGLDGIHELSRRPHRSPHAISDDIAGLLVEERTAHPRWGPRKVLGSLERQHADLKLPAPSTVGDLFKRLGLVKDRKRRDRTRPHTTPLAEATAPNMIWCADFKGWFHAGDGSRCEPLTITDAYSRFLLKCQLVRNSRFESVKPVFEAAFREFGMPRVIRTDNGPPFASVGLAGLSELSIWWIRLGIRPERIQPGHPEQNGRHERMHRTLKQETALPPSPTIKQQQAAFDHFRREYNCHRPHEALGQRTPAELYEASSEPMPATLPEMVYPMNFVIRPIKKSGQFYWDGHRVYTHYNLNGETIGFEQVTPRYWRVYFGPIPIALFDAQAHKLIAQAARYDRLSLATQSRPRPRSRLEWGAPRA